MNTIDYLRQFRIGGYAIFDFAVSFLAMNFLAPLLSKACSKLGIQIPKKSWLLFTLPLSILVHVIVGTITPMTANFLNIYDQYLLKLFILTLIYLGIRPIKKQPKQIE